MWLKSHTQKNPLQKINSVSRIKSLIKLCDGLVTTHNRRVEFDPLWLINDWPERSGSSQSENICCSQFSSAWGGRFISHIRPQSFRCHQEVPLLRLQHHVSSQAVVRAWRAPNWGQTSLEDLEAATLPAVSDGVSLALGTDFPGGVCH